MTHVHSSNETPDLTKSIHEECGVVGLYGVADASRLAYYALHSLQHRGQQGCGIVTHTPNADTDFYVHKGEGLVNEIFNEQNLSLLKGNMAVGHVRYPTSHVGGIENVQPFTFHHYTGDFALAHNGNIVNAQQIRNHLEHNGSLLQTTSDSELFAHFIVKQQSSESRIYRIIDALKEVDGAFSLVIMSRQRLYVCRDPYGFHPLPIGKLGDGYVVASETCAIDAIGATYLRDVEPGEIVSIDHHGLRSNYFADIRSHHNCVMEYIYFARPDSDIEGCNVHRFRKIAGELLFEEHPADADIVVGVPESSLSAAMGYAEASGLPYEMGLIKSKYVGRTFIQPNQEMRDKGVKMKLSAVRSVVDGKRVVLIDDSIVRGTTSRQIVKMLKDAGAKEVHVRIASPVYSHPCYYGVDTGTYEELIGANHSIAEICHFLGADSLCYLSVEALHKATGCGLCDACFSGIYPSPLYQHEHTDRQSKTRKSSTI